MKRPAIPQNNANKCEYGNIGQIVTAIFPTANCGNQFHYSSQEENSSVKKKGENWIDCTMEYVAND
jgi:hypothetical protein